MCSRCDYEETLELLTELLNDRAYEWANDTLSGIEETILVRSHVTERQLEAIENIKNAVEDRR